MVAVVMVEAAGEGQQVALAATVALAVTVVTAGKAGAEAVVVGEVGMGRGGGRRNLRSLCQSRRRRSLN